MSVKELKDKVEDTLDKVEEDYIDPLKDKIEEVSKEPLSFIKEHGKKVVFGAIGAVVLIGVICVIYELSKM